MRFGFYKKYFFLAIVIFLVEVLIALYVHDSFVRPYVGDYLVVFLVYCGVRSFCEMRVWPAAIGVLLFSYLIEILQYFHIVHVLGLDDVKIARIVIGTGFSWWDMLAYTLGVLTIVWMENKTADR